jgi:D-alanyl-D-alanine carboxypeptidase
MGGRTAGARDAVMESLIADHLAEASNKGRAATAIAAAEPAPSLVVPLPPVQPAAEPAPSLAVPLPPVQPAAAPTQARPATAVAADLPSPPARPAAAPIEEGDSAAEDEEDGAPRVAAALAPAAIAQRPAATPRAAPPAPENRVAEATPEQLGWVKGPDPASPAKPQAAPKAAPPVAAKPQAASPVARPKEESEVARAGQASLDDRAGWVIQIGASDDADKANDLLIRARAKNRATLAAAKSFTERIKKGEEVFYRARFAGLDSASAEAACRSLKKSGFACFATRD